MEDVAERGRGRGRVRMRGGGRVRGRGRTLVEEAMAKKDNSFQMKSEQP